ncbi:hypothetical protein LTR10_008531 [Elasticomyces elasticus]|nr:hypothetical protein LTR10_008531 [Elasticomyces elasticus]KAK4967404.1 hypothetical protein LTR42_010753 [Elasticomyces elasticus]
MAAFMRGHLLLAVRSPSITTALTGQGVKVGFVSASRIATRKFSLWPFTWTSIQASTKENSTSINESNTPIKAATKDNSTHRLRVRALNSVPKEYTIKIDLYDDKPALELVYRDDQDEHDVIADFMEKHGVLDSGRSLMSATGRMIRRGLYRTIVDQTGGQVSTLQLEVGVVKPEQATPANGLKLPKSGLRMDAAPGVVSTAPPTKAHRFHANGLVAFDSVVNEYNGRKLLESVRERLITVVPDHGYSGEYYPPTRDVTSLPAGFVDLDLITHQSMPASHYHYRLSFICVGVSEEEVVRIKKALGVMSQIDSVGIGPAYGDTELRRVVRRKRELMEWECVNLRR